MSVYDDFREAHVKHIVFGKDASCLAAARARMMADPNYDARKYEEAVESAHRIEAVYSVAWPQSEFERPG
jgi:hypothetical protein